MLDESVQQDAEEEEALSAVPEQALAAVLEPELAPALSAVPEGAAALPKASTSWFKAAKKHCRQCGKASTKVERRACKVCGSASMLTYADVC
jgi:ribosomal protein L37E